jgi:hypothetical protein
MDNPKDNQELEEQPVKSKGETKPAVLNASHEHKEQYVLTDEDRKAIAGAVAEIDIEQANIVRKLTPAQRFQQVMSMINATERATAYRLRQREPELSEIEALRIVRGGLLEYELRKRRT